MRILAMSDSPLLNTSYGTQTAMWANVIGTHHQVEVAGQGYEAGKGLDLMNYKIISSKTDKLKKIFRRGYVDIVYTHTDPQRLHVIERRSNDFVWIGRLALDTEFIHKSWYNMFEKMDVIVIESKYSADMVRARGFEDKVRHIYPMLSPNYTNRELGNAPNYKWHGDDFLLLSVARPFWRKNIPMILTVMDRLVNDERLDVKLFLHTDFKDSVSTQMDYELMIHAMGLNDNVIIPRNLHFDEGVPEKILGDLYETADALLSPNLGEGFGLTLAESMACGTPVITTDATSGPELVGDDRGKLIEIDRRVKIGGQVRPLPSIDSIIDNVKFYMDNPDEKKAHGENAMNWARNEFEINNISVKWFKLLDEYQLNTVMLDEDKIRGSL